MKACSRCGEEKPLSDYFKQQLAKRAPFCKDCRRAALETRRKNRQAYQRERAAGHRTRLNELKVTLSCVDCGWAPADVSECWRLQFDHIDPSTKWTTRRAGAFQTSWAWERILVEIALCEPRCASCHSRRTTRQLQGLDPYPIRPAHPLPFPPTPIPTARSLHDG